MSIIVITYITDGIVMASDSRRQASATGQPTGGADNHGTLFISDSNDSLFLTASRVGIGATESSLNGKPTQEHLQTFIDEHCTDTRLTADAVAAKLLKYVRQLQAGPKTTFFVAGYKGKEQQVWRVRVDDHEVNQINASGQVGVSFAGEGDAIVRLLRPVGELDEGGRLLNPLPHFDNTVAVFTLQDAIDFSIFLVRTQIDIVRFQKRLKTVGGPIDVLLLRPNQADWIQKKQLRGE